VCAASSEDADGSTFQLDLKDRQYILKALMPQEAQQWVDVLIFLRDGGGAAAANATKKAGSAASTPTKEAPASSAPRQPAPPGEEGWVKNNSGGGEPGMDQCAAGCAIA